MLLMMRSSPSIFPGSSARDEKKVTIKHNGTEIFVSESVARDYRNCEPKCGIQMACFQSDWWWKGSQLSYKKFGYPLIMAESTIPIDLWTSNQKKGISTLATIAHLQFGEFFGFDKDCNGQYINSTLSRVQQ